ncbi:MAG: pyridoxal-phosphate dependent enzyme [Terrimesophilobacter sp.]
MTSSPGPLPTLARISLAALPTPLVRASGLSAALGAGPIWIKRDDLTGFGVSGNKARALEFLIGDALNLGCDVIVAAGSPSSNFCAAAAMAARVAGLECDLLFPGPEPTTASINVGLARASGARLHFNAVTVREELDGAVSAYAGTLSAEGRRPYPLPRGGATAVGGVGYALAAREFSAQSEQAGISAGTIVVAAGSGGTMAGLVAGVVGYHLPWRVIGASVSRPVEQIADHVLELSRQCAKRLGLPLPSESDVEVRDLRGPGFGIASVEDRVSARLALSSEGLLLDDYYGAKAMTLLRALIAEHRSMPMVFWHTGGVSAALMAMVTGEYRS